MWAEYLPCELLQKIFLLLDGDTVIKCRKVCTRWRDVVDLLSNKDWMHILRTGKQPYELMCIMKKYGLPWPEVFKASDSWKPWATQTSEVVIREHRKDVKWVKVLPNDILACLENNSNRSCIDFSDTVIYYDLNTSKELKRINFGFHFLSRQYDENEHLYVMIMMDGNLSIVVKNVREKYVVGNLKNHGIYYDDLCFQYAFSEFTLINKEVFFKDYDSDIIYVSRLTKDDTIKTSPLRAFRNNNDTFHEDVVQFCYHNNRLHILTANANIFLHAHRTFVKIYHINFKSTTLFQDLLNYGFNWKSRAIYTWLNSSGKTKESFVLNPYFNAFYGHGNIILYGSLVNRGVGLYYINAPLSNLNDLISLVKAKPTKKLDLAHIMQLPSTSLIQQVDIVESKSSDRKILIVTQNCLYILELETQSTAPLNTDDVKRFIDTIYNDRELINAIDTNEEISQLLHNWKLKDIREKQDLAMKMLTTPAQSKYNIKVMRNIERAHENEQQKKEFEETLLDYFDKNPHLFAGISQQVYERLDVSHIPPRRYITRSFLKRIIGVNVKEENHESQASNKPRRRYLTRSSKRK